MDLDSMKRILDYSEQEHKAIWEIVLESDMENRMVSREASWEKMRHTWRAMVESADAYSGDLRSRSGLVGGDGRKVSDYYETRASIGGTFTAQVISQALAMGENNACMRRIVAAPTAGSCGVMPAVLIPLWRREKIPEDRMLEALYVTCAIGSVIASRASISGAAGGCQAEVGSASAMAAGALTYLQGGSSAQICHAVAIAVKNLLGLVCDPVAGLVEVPCVKRNVIGAMNAIAAADMAVAGVESRIPVDEVIDAMGDVGRRLPVEFRETAQGGLAVTPTGRAVQQRMQQSRKRYRTLTIKDSRWKLAAAQPDQTENGASDA